MWDTNLNIELYKKMYLIRKSENIIVENYFDDEMKTPMHMSKGSEAILAGACTALEEKDQVFGSYRSHALYLAKTGDTDGFFAEMYGKRTGTCKGKAGSMHLSNPERGHISSSAVVASNIPVAVGAAFANKMKKNNKVVAVFFGDGAMDEGNFWESINMACVWQLPIVFMCEDNDLAVHTSKEKRQGYEQIGEILFWYDMEYRRGSEYDVTDAYDAYKSAANAIHFARKENKPGFVHYEYYRYLEHVGVSEDFDQGYRDRNENIKDPLERHIKHLIYNNVTRENINKIERDIDDKVNKSLEFAKSSSLPSVEDLYKDVFCE